MKHTSEIQITKVRTMILITSKIKTKTTSTIIITQEPATKKWEPRPRKLLHQEQPPRKASQHISHVEWTCQQRTAVQDTRSTETSITVPGQTQTRGLTSDW